jgi:hypothetical protein
VLGRDLPTIGDWYPARREEEEHLSGKKGERKSKDGYLSQEEESSRPEKATGGRRGKVTRRKVLFSRRGKIARRKDT